MMNGRPWKSRYEDRTERPVTIRTGHQRQSDTFKNTTEIGKKWSAKKKGDSNGHFQRCSNKKGISGDKRLASTSPLDKMTGSGINKLQKNNECLEDVTKTALLSACDYKSVLGGVDYKAPFFPAACTISLCPACRDLECTMRNDGEVMKVNYKEPSTSLITTTAQRGDTSKHGSYFEDKKHGSLQRESACKRPSKYGNVSMDYDCGNHRQSILHPEHDPKKPRNYSAGPVLPSKLSLKKTDECTKLNMSDKQDLKGNETCTEFNDKSPFNNRNKIPHCYKDSTNTRTMSRRSLSVSNRGIGGDKNTSRSNVLFSRYGDRGSEQSESQTSINQRDPRPNQTENASRGTEGIRYSRRESLRPPPPVRNPSPGNRERKISPKRSPSPTTRVSPLQVNFNRMSMGQNVLIRYNDGDIPSTNRSNANKPESNNSFTNIKPNIATSTENVQRQPHDPDRLPIELIPKLSKHSQEEKPIVISSTRKSSRQAAVLLSKKNTAAGGWRQDTAAKDAINIPTSHTRRNNSISTQPYYDDVRECERDTERECIRNSLAKNPGQSMKDIKLECQLEAQRKCHNGAMNKRDSLVAQAEVPPRVETNIIRNCLDIDGRVCPVGNAQEMKLLTNYYQKKKKTSFWQSAISSVFDNVVFTTQAVVIGTLVFFLLCFLQDVNHFFQMAVVFLVMTFVYMMVCQPFSNFP